MKKIILLVALMSFSLYGWTQISSYRYHELEDLGTTIERAISIECTHHFQPERIMEVNLRQNFKYEVGKIYKVDLGLNYGNFGTRYYKVTYAADYGVDKGDEIDTPPNFGAPITDFCNQLSWKYIRPILLGSTLQEAQNNYCSNTTANTTDEKVNIKITYPPAVGDVYLMDFGLGSKYYIINSASVEKGDSDYDLDTTNNNVVFSYVSPNSLNCPAPDIQAVSATIISTTPINAGENISVFIEYKNIGNMYFSSNLSRVKYYLSDSSSLVLLGESYLSSLDINQSKTGTVSLTIPSNTNNGTYSIIMKVFASGDSNTNNDSVSSLNFIVNSQPDSDGDGVLDNSDVCPNLYGNPSNYGCPGNPDLVINEELTKQYSDCYSCNSYLDNLYNRPTIYRYGGNITLNPLVIKNIGNGDLVNWYGSNKIKFYLSSDQNLDLVNLNQGNGNDIGFDNRSVEIYSGIISGGNYNTAVSIEGSDIGNRVPYGNYYLVIVIDSENSLGNSEINKSNNIYYLPVKYTGTLSTGKSLSNKTQTSNSTTITLNEENTLIEPYSIDIYNFQGQKVLSREVASIEEENKLIQSLSSGLYIVKSKNKTYKISKN